jgi:hypothetical protein
MKDAIWLIIIVGVLIYACSPGKLEDRPDYKKGYEAGHADGMQDGRDDTCQDIENAKDSIHSFLQNAGICP